MSGELDGQGGSACGNAARRRTGLALGLLATTALVAFPGSFGPFGIGGTALAAGGVGAASSFRGNVTAGANGSNAYYGQSSPGQAGTSTSGGGGGSAGGGAGGSGGGGAAGGQGGVNGTLNGAAGSAGTSTGGGGGGGQGGYNGTGVATPTVPSSTNTGTLVGGSGGAGGASGTGGANGGGGGGEGGYGTVILGSGTAAAPLNNSNTGTITGGTGGQGGFGSFSGGTGGDGGYGVLSIGDNIVYQNQGQITGGNGGNGGATTGAGGAGGGGTGGDGLHISGLNILVTNQGSLTGGLGGSAQSSGYGGDGGNGLNFSSAGGVAVNAASGTITGGAGGAGGLSGGAGGYGVNVYSGTFNNAGTVVGGAGGFSQTGNGGNGGYGVQGGGGATLFNTGTIRGGAGGAIGADGINPGGGGGGVGASGMTVINNGTIVGGLSGDGTIRYNAIDFGGVGNVTNRLEIWAGSVITGNVVVFGGTATLALGGATNASFDASQLGPVGSPTAQYQGFTAYEKTGSSTWTLTGSNALSDPWSVNSGILNVTGSLAAAPFTVASGGTLAGSGTLGSLSVASGGIVAPGAVAGAPTTLNVANGLTFAGGSTYRVTASPTAADRITVASGTATLGGASLAVQFGQGTYGATNTYTILSAPTVSGTFGSVTSNLAFLSPSLSYNATSVVLSYTRTTTGGTGTGGTGTGGTGTGGTGTGGTGTGGTGTGGTGTGGTGTGGTGTGGTGPGTIVTFASVAQTASQRAAATAVEALGSGPLFDAVLTQTTAGARQAFDALSGEVQASAASAQVQTAFLVQETLFDHLRFGESNGFAQGLGLSSPGLTGSVGQRFAPGTTLPATYSADLPGRQVIGLVPVTPRPPAYAVWGQAFGAFGDTAATTNSARLTRQTGGFLLGIETGPGVLGGPFDGWSAGVAGGYSYTSFAVSARQSSGQVESALAAVYARGPVGPLQLRLGAVYSSDALDSRRAVLFPGFSQVATGKSGGDSAYGFGEVGYRIGTGAGYVEPFAGGSALHLRRDGFSEVGGSAALTVFGRSYDIETASAGVQGQFVLSSLFGTERPVVARGLIGYRRAFGDVVPQALLAFGGGTQAFQTAGAPIARDAVIASAGLDWQVANNTSVGLAYTGQVAARAQDHAVKGSFQYRW